jgi:CrcB protein
MEYILVGLGGIAGSLARFAAGRAINRAAGTKYALGTLMINLTGSILLGLVIGIGTGSSLYSFIAIGFLGAYTTFSTYIYEGFLMLRSERFAAALVYIIGSLLLGITGFYFGLQAGEIMLAFIR